MPARKEPTHEEFSALLALLSAAAVWACDEAGEDLPDSSTTSPTPSSTPLPSAAPTPSPAPLTPSLAPATTPSEQPAVPSPAPAETSAPVTAQLWPRHTTGNASFSYPPTLTPVDTSGRNTPATQFKASDETPTGFAISVSTLKGIPGRMVYEFNACVPAPQSLRRPSMRTRPSLHC